jgi:hypothetical protein
MALIQGLDGVLHIGIDAQLSRNFQGALNDLSRAQIGVVE